MPVPWAAAARAGLAAGIMFAAVSALPASGGWAELLSKSGLGALVYGAVIMAIDGDLRRRAKGVLSARRLRSAS
jgi:hypothetical protein